MAWCLIFIRSHIISLSHIVLLGVEYSFGGTLFLSYCMVWCLMFIRSHIISLRLYGLVLNIHQESRYFSLSYCIAGVEYSFGGTFFLSHIMRLVLEYLSYYTAGVRMSLILYGWCQNMHYEAHYFSQIVCLVCNIHDLPAYFIPQIVTEYDPTALPTPAGFSLTKADAEQVIQCV